MLYTIATVATLQDGKWNRTIQLPTFYLDSNVQGIRDAEHAQQIAESMFAAVNPEATFSVFATERS